MKEELEVNSSEEVVISENLGKGTKITMDEDGYFKFTMPRKTESYMPFNSASEMLWGTATTDEAPVAGNSYIDRGLVGGSGIDPFPDPNNLYQRVTTINPGRGMYDASMFEEEIKTEGKQEEKEERKDGGVMDHFVRFQELKEKQVRDMKERNRKIAEGLSTSDGRRVQLSGDGMPRRRVQRNPLTIGEDNDEFALILTGGDSAELLRFDKNGDIYVKGNFVQIDSQIVDAMRNFLRANKFHP